MSRLPTACSHCQRTFSNEAHGARLALIEADVALCDRCMWLVDHPESVDLTRTERDLAA